MSADPGVRHTVLRGLALNRTPGYHFTGHFLSVSHDHVSVETARTSMKVGPHCAEANGSINHGALSVFADLSMAANGQPVCFGTGAFMVLDPPKGQTLQARQLRREQDADVAPHVQGGVTMALGLATAEAALPAEWMTSAVSAWFIGPCEGRVIESRSEIVHRGRLTSVARTAIVGASGRRAMEMMTTHTHKDDRRTP